MIENRSSRRNDGEKMIQVIGSERKRIVSNTHRVVSTFITRLRSIPPMQEVQSSDMANSTHYEMPNSSDMGSRRVEASKTSLRVASIRNIGKISRLIIAPLLVFVSVTLIPLAALPATASNATTPGTLAHNPGAAGNCTWYAEYRWQQFTGQYINTLGGSGNAYLWAANAKAHGWTITTTPTANSIVVFQPYPGRAGSVGHVAWVDQVSGNTIHLWEMNFATLYKVTQRTVNGYDPSLNADGLTNIVYILPSTVSPPASLSPPPSSRPFVNQAHGLCLDAASQTLSVNGGTVQLWTCVGDTNQQWYWSGHQIVNASDGKCLDANWSTDGTYGGKVEIWSCNNGSNQQWTANGSGQLVNSAHGLCLDADWGTDGNNGGIVHLWGCNTGPNQKWSSSAPVSSAPAASPPSSTVSYAYSVVGAATLYERSQPSTNSAIVGSLPDGATINIVCQTPGTNVFGTIVWDRLSNGAYVTDYYTTTPVQLSWSPPIPRC